MAITVSAAIHGVTDPVFPSHLSMELVNPEDPALLTPAEKERAFAHAKTIRERVAVEANRMEGQLSLMLAHVEGSAESEFARLSARKIWLPLCSGFVIGVGLTLALVYIR